MKPNRDVSPARALPISIALSAALAAGCDRSNESQNATASSSAATTETAGSASPASAQPASAQAAGAQAGSAGSCPTGRWEYDYSDQFLESLTRNISGARVVSEKGKVLCTFTGAERGTYECQVSEGGVENVMEATTAGGKLLVTVKIAGRSKVDYEAAGSGRFKTTQADMSGLRLDTSAKIGGVDFPIPAMNLFPGMDRAGTVFEYRCAGDTLQLKPEIPDVTTDWANLKRAP